ncbi:Ig-like domain-containing protein [Streptomyces sp. NPDC052077]|uniref:L,D-transpeptidase n=1 Tax=Streptomyces sp. NPDC052077 TaxID=3154757 RepID=UPI00344A0BE3
MRHRQGRARRAGAALAAVLTWTGLLAGTAGCSGGGVGFGEVFGKPSAAREVIRVTPGDGAAGVPPGGRLSVRVPDGRLESVRVVVSQDAGEREVPGHVSADGLGWRPADDRLAPAARYTVDAVAVDGLGRRSARRTTFTTRVPDERFIGHVVPEDRAVVGTGMIVSLEFSRTLTDRAAVERGVSVTAEPAVEIRPHWFGNDRLDFRPETYWTPGTEVTVALDLRDVEGAPGVYGMQRRTFSFTVGRSQVSVVDAAERTMRVSRDGTVVATLPVTAGASATPTYNGRMVISEMLDVTRMDSRTVGFGGEYDIPDVPHAIRLTASGTFLHGNYWSPGDTFGRANVSHGCVGLRDVRGGGADTPAGWFFDRSLVGDVVEVVHSADRTVDADNGLGGWNMPWRRWTAGSAVH